MEKRYTAPKTTKPSRASPLTVTSTQPALVKKPSRVRECEKRNGRDDSISEGNISLNESLDSESILKVRQQKDAAELLALKRENESLMEKLNLVEQEKKKLQDNENKLNFKIKALEIEKQEAKADLIKSKGVLQIVQTSNGSLMQEIEKLKSVISTAKGCSDVEQLKKEKEELVKKIEGLKSDVDNLKGVKCSVEMEHLRLKTSVQDLRQQKDTASKDLSELKAELEKIRASSKSSSPRDAKDEIESIRLLTVSFKNEIARLEKENSQLKEKMKEVENQKKEASEEIEKISKQLVNSKEVISQKQKEIQDLGQQMSIMMKKDDADKLLKERDELKLRNEKLKKELEDLKKHKVAIQTELLYLKEKVQELEKQKEEANAGLIKAKSVSQIVQVNNQNLIQELEKLKQVKSPTSGSAAGFIGWGEVEKLKQERDDLVHKILNLKKDTDDIKKERNSLESERMQLKEKIEELEQRKEEVSVDLGRMKIEFERLQMSNSQSLQEIEKSFQLSAMMPRDEVEELYREKGDIRDDTESLRILTSCLENEKSKLEIENCHLKEKVEQLEQLKEETSVEIEKTVSQLEGSKARLVQNEQEIQSLNAQILGMVNREEAEKLRKERDCLNKTIEDLRKDTSMIQEQKESLKVKIVDLEGKVEKLEKEKEELRSVYVAQCEKAFGLLNLNESASIKKDEFVEIIKECAIIQSEEEILRLFNEIDNEGNNEITLARFLKVVCNEEAGSKYTQFIESVIRKAEEIISLKNRKTTPQIQLLTSSTPEPTLNLVNDGWVERQTEVEIKNKEVQKPLKAKAFFMNRNLDDLDTSAKQEESSQLYLMTSPTASSFSLGQEKMMRSYTPTYMNGGITFQNHLDKSAVGLTSQTPKDGVEQKRGRIPRLFGGDQDKAKRAPGNRSEQPRQIQKPIYVERGHRLEKGVDQFLKALGNSNTVDPELKEELKMCVKDLPNKELDKMANLARPERIAFLSSVIGQFKDSKTNGNKYSAKIEHLEQILEKERNQLKTEQGEIRKLRIMGLVGLSPFVQNFSSPTAGGRGGRPQNK